MSRAANGAAAMGERGLLSSAFAVSPDLSLSPFRSCQKSGIFRGSVEVKRRGIANAGMRSKRTRAGFMQGVVAAAKDVWSIAGANTARQAMMGMGAGVATEDVLTVRHDTEVREEGGRERGAEREGEGERERERERESIQPCM